MMMMEDDKLIKAIKLRGGALETAKTYSAVLEEAREEYQREHDEAVVRLRNLQTQHMARLREAWLDMAKQVFPVEEANKTWQNSNYRLDVTYLEDHNTAYLNVYNEKSPITDVQDTLILSGSSSGGLLH